MQAGLSADNLPTYLSREILFGKPIQEILHRCSYKVVSHVMLHRSFCYCFGQQKKARFVHVGTKQAQSKASGLSCAGGERDLPVGLGLIIMFFCLLVVYCHGRPLSGKMTTSSPSVFNSYPRGRYYPSHETVPNKEPGAKLCKKITPIGVLQIVDGESII